MRIKNLIYYNFYIDKFNQYLQIMNCKLIIDFGKRFFLNKKYERKKN